MAGDQVLDPSHRADHDVAAGAQLCLLAADRRAAEHGHDIDTLALAVRAERLRDLDAQLARRRQHETLDLGLGGIDVLEHRQPERRGLARTGLRLADHVGPAQQRRDGLLLDRARRLIADIANRLEQVGSEAQVGECGHAHLTIDGTRSPCPRRGTLATAAKTNVRLDGRQTLDRLRYGT